MIQINIPMPKSCTKCPFFNEEYETCPLAPMVPAMQNDVRNSVDKRSEYCPMKEVPEEEHFKLKTPEKCGDCESITPFGEKYYCHMDSISSDSPHQDISTIFVSPELRPEWCPITRMNSRIEEMPSDKREDFDKFMTGLSSLFDSINKLEEES